MKIAIGLVCAGFAWSLGGCSSGKTGLHATKDAGLGDVPMNGDVGAASADGSRAADSEGAPDAGSDTAMAGPEAGASGGDAGSAVDSANVSDSDRADGSVSKLDGANGEVAPSTLGSGLAAWWRADGNAFDSVGPANGTMQGGLAFVDGRFGQAFQFNGTDTTVTVKSSSSLAVDKAFTLALWIRIHSNPSLHTVVLRKLVVGSEDKNVVLTTDGRMGFYFYNVMSGNTLVAATPLTVDTWHHVAMLYDGKSAKLYMDGTLDASVAASGTIVHSTGTLIFGQSLDFPYFNGALDEIRWYSRALSDAEIAQLAAGGT